MNSFAANILDGKATFDSGGGEAIPGNKFEDNINVIEGKGEFLAGGATGLVERLESGDIVKSPWTSPSSVLECKQEITIEARIYERLGSHPRLVQLKHWDPVGCTLTLEYMPNGNLKDYIEKHGQSISIHQKRIWASQAAESIQLLHSFGVFQGDVGPHNFLLDKELSLKICDFAGSSLNGSKAMVVPGVRYRLPGAHSTSAKEDLFALGSTIYFIATGYAPHHDVADEGEVEKLFVNGEFPELNGVPFANAIALCWRQEAESAQVIYQIIKRS